MTTSVSGWLQWESRILFIYPVPLFSQAHAIRLGPPLPPSAHQGKIQPQAHRFGPEFLRQARVALQLRRVTLDLAIEKLLHAAAQVLAGLVVNHPTHAGIVDEAAIEDHTPHLALPMPRKRVFAKIVPVAGLQNPAPARILEHREQGLGDARCGSL